MSSTYQTNWIPNSPNRKVGSPNELVTRGFLHFAGMLIPRKLFRNRTVDKVRTNYNSDRQKMLDDLERIDWDSYIFFPESMQDFTLVNDTLKFSQLREPRKLLLEKMKNAVASVARPGATVVEFGSGDGRNLMYLKKCFPEMKFVGFELSDVSVELSKLAAKKFGVDDVSFHCADATAPLPVDLSNQNVVCCFSSFALEMMPNIFSKAVDQMVSLSKDLVVFFEPVDELWSNDLRGLTSKLRVQNLHRLKGLYPYAREIEKRGGWNVTKAERSGIAINPFNEMVEIQLKKKK